MEPSSHGCRGAILRMHTKSRARRTRTRQAELFEDPSAADSGRAAREPSPKADKAGPKAVPQPKRKAAAPPKKRREDARSMAARQREISVSEFFTKNRHLLGFDNPSKALLTAVREAVDNSLDACEEAGILPDLEIEIQETGDGQSCAEAQSQKMGGRPPGRTSECQPRNPVAATR